MLLSPLLVISATAGMSPAVIVAAPPSSPSSCVYTSQSGSMLVMGSELRAANYSNLSSAERWCSASALCRGFTFEVATASLRDDRRGSSNSPLPPCFDPGSYKGQATFLVHFKFGVVQVVPQHGWVSAVRGATASPTVVNTPLGLLRGMRSFPAGCSSAPSCASVVHSVDQFLGIRYSEPIPADGSGRWRHATPKASWVGILDALDYGNACTSQGQTPGKVKFANKPCEEDCLFLNVVSPSHAIDTQARLPVLVWVHGGSFLEGSGSDNVDADGPGNGTWVASSNNLVLVTLNYRLGVFG
eukprot:COSAG01_NODE_3453_length_6077_cov_8.916527_5_plen_300_part_00